MGEDKKMAKTKVEIIPKPRVMDCWSCEGKGCAKCNGSGKFVETYYIMVYTNKKGQKTAFGMDTIK